MPVQWFVFMPIPLLPSSVCGYRMDYQKSRAQNINESFEQCLANHRVYGKGHVMSLPRKITHRVFFAVVCIVFLLSTGVPITMLTKPFRYEGIEAVVFIVFFYAPLVVSALILSRYALWWYRWNQIKRGIRASDEFQAIEAFWDRHWLHMALQPMITYLVLGQKTNQQAHKRYWNEIAQRKGPYDERVAFSSATHDLEEQAKHRHVYELFYQRLHAVVEQLLDDQKKYTPISDEDQAPYLRRAQDLIDLAHRFEEAQTSSDRFQLLQELLNIP